MAYSAHCKFNRYEKMVSFSVKFDNNVSYQLSFQLFLQVRHLLKSLMELVPIKFKFKLKWLQIKDTKIQIIYNMN